MKNFTEIITFIYPIHIKTTTKNYISADFKRLVKSITFGWSFVISFFLFNKLYLHEKNVHSYSLVILSFVYNVYIV